MEPKFTWDEIFVKGELFASVKCTVVQRARAAVDWNVQSVSDLAVWRIDKQHSAEGEDYCVPFVKVRYTVKNGGPLRTSSWMPLLAFHAFFLDRSKASEKNAAIEGDHTVVMEWVIETLARQLCSTCKFPAGKDPKFCRLHNTAKASKGKGTGRIGGLSAIPDNSWKSRLPGGFTFYPVAKDHLGFALMSTATNEEATRFGYVSNSRVFSIGAYRLFRTAFDTMNVPDMTDSALTDAGLDAATIAEGNKRHSHKRKLVRPSLSPPSLAGGDGGAPAAKRSRVSEGGDAKPTAAQQQLQQPQSVAASKSASKLPSSSSASSSLSLQPSAGAATTATATAAAASKSKRPEYRVVGSGVPPRNDSIILAQWRSALRIVDGMHCDLQMRHSSTLKARDNEVARADARAKAAEAEAAALRARESSGVLGGAQQQQQQQSARDSAVSSSAAASEQQQQQASSDALALRAQLEELRAREAKLELENAALKSDLAGEKARNLEKEKTVKQLRDRLYGGAASSAGSTVFSSGSTAASPALVAAAAPAVAAAASSPVPPPTTSAVPSQRPLPRVVGSDSVSAAAAASSHRSLKPAPAPSSGVSTPVLQSRVATPVPQPTITPVLEVMREEPPQSSVRTSTTAAAAEEEEEEPPQLPARAAAADASQQLAPAASSLSSADAAAEEAAESDTDTSEGEAAEGGAQLVNGKNDGSGSDDEESVVEGAMEEDEIASEKSESAPLTDTEARGGERESSSVAIPAAETTADDDSGAALGDDAAAAAAAAAAATAGSAKPRYEFSDDSDDEKEEEEGVGAGELSSATAAAADTGSLAVDVVDAVAGEAFPSPLASPRFSGDDSDDEADAARLPKTADAMREDDDAVNREIGAEMRGFEDADGAQRDEAAPAPSVVEAGVAAAESSPEGITDLLVSSSPSAE